MTFSIGSHYKDRIYCDVAPLDICHLLLGRPWVFDRKIIHDGAANTYSFLWETRQIVLLPSRESTTSPAPTSTTPPGHLPSRQRPAAMICSYAAFMTELRTEGTAFALFP